MTTCSECAHAGPPGAIVCEVCSAFMQASECTDDQPAEVDNDARPPDGACLVTARRLWDGLSDTCVEGECGVGVAIVGESIAWCGLLEDLPEHFTSLPTMLHHAADDSTLMPGLIDSHVHMEFDPLYGLHMQPVLEDAVHMRQMQARAHAMVRHGITTARDLGGKGGAIKLRSLLEAGACPGPRLLCAGQPITVPGGHCHQWGGEAAGSDAIRAVVRRQIVAPTRADLVKVMATGGVRTAGTNPAEAAFTLAEMRACVEEATAAGRPCAAHAHGVRGIANAAEAGVTTIEHCSWVAANGSWGHDEASVVATIARKGIYVCPTVGAGWATKPMLTSALSPALRRMRAAGVQLLAGSDAGAIPQLDHHRLADGLVVMAECAQLSHADALRSATSAAAAAHGLTRTCGALAVGLSADVLVVRGKCVQRCSEDRSGRMRHAEMPWPPRTNAPACRRPHSVFSCLARHSPGQSTA